jgi:hypothetical protein
MFIGLNDNNNNNSIKRLEKLINITMESMTDAMESVTDVLEDEAYDPWPGCIMDRTGCHGQSYYTKKYSVKEQLISFFRQADKSMSYTDFDNIIIDYAINHNGIIDDKAIICYDEALWNLLELDKDIPLKYYHICKHFEKFIISF